MFSDTDGVVERTRCTVQGWKSQFTVTLEGENARNRILRTIRPLLGKRLELNLLLVEQQSEEIAQYIVVMSQYMKHFITYKNVF